MKKLNTLENIKKYNNNVLKNSKKGDEIICDQRFEIDGVVYHTIKNIGQYKKPETPEWVTDQKSQEFWEETIERKYEDRFFYEGEYKYNGNIFHNIHYSGNHKCSEHINVASVWFDV